MYHSNSSALHRDPGVLFAQVGPALGAHVLHHGGVRAARGEPEDSLLRSQNITHLGLQLRDILRA